MSKPILFSSIDRALGLQPGTVAGLATEEGFPASEGEGVAVLEDVRAWMALRGVGREASQLEEAVSGAAESTEGGSDVPGGDFFDDIVGGAPSVEVDYVTIRIPVVRGSDMKLASRINQTFTLRKNDLHIREAFGDILAGCIQSGKQLSDMTSVNSFSAVYRLLGELVADEISASSASSA